jgi:uncharacterized membrane protein
MDREETNRSEWENAENWSDALVGVYFSKRDSRTWVPKRPPGIGWTLNLGHPAGAWWLVGLIVAPPLLIRLLRGRR